MNRRQSLQTMAKGLTSPWLIKAGILGGAAVSVAGCAGPQVADYSQQKPALDLRTYFNGPVDAWGVFTDRSGAVVKRFKVQMYCQWQGDDGVLYEDFQYSDGNKQRRIWRLKALPNGKYEGRADDVVGVAQGAVSGNAFRWQYTLALPVDGRVWNVEFDDWMLLMDEEVMINKAVMSKFGVRLGEVTLSFKRRKAMPTLTPNKGQS
jgi:hypothetical protein